MIEPAPEKKKPEKAPTANEILEVASARRVSVAPAKKNKPTTARDAMRLRVQKEAEEKRGPAGAKKADKKSAKPQKKGAKKPPKARDDGEARDEDEDEPPSLTKRSEDVQRASDDDAPPPKLGFWARVKKLLGGR